jgi:hypothetical protein
MESLSWPVAALVVCVIVASIFLKKWLKSKGVDTSGLPSFDVSELLNQFATSGSDFMKNWLSDLQKGNVQSVNNKVLELQNSNNIEATFDKDVAIPLAKQAIVNAANAKDHETLKTLQESLDTAKAQLATAATAAISATAPQV